MICRSPSSSTGFFRCPATPMLSACWSALPDAESTTTGMEESAGSFRASIQKLAPSMTGIMRSRTIMRRLAPGRDADALVPHHDADRARRGIRGPPLDGAAPPVLGGVREQVGHDLLDAQRVPEAPERRLGQLEPQLAALPIQLVAEERGH